MSVRFTSASSIFRRPSTCTVTVTGSPSSILIVGMPVTLASVNRPSATWWLSTEASRVRFESSASRVPGGRASKASSVGAKTV